MFFDCLCQWMNNQVSPLVLLFWAQLSHPTIGTPESRQLLLCCSNDCAWFAEFLCDGNPGGARRSRGPEEMRPAPGPRAAAFSGPYFSHLNLSKLVSCLQAERALAEPSNYQAEQSSAYEQNGRPLQSLLQMSSVCWIMGQLLVHRLVGPQVSELPVKARNPKALCILCTAEHTQAIPSRCF